MTTEIPVFYAIDEYYAPMFTVALASLIANVDTSGAHHYHVTVVYSGLKDETKKIIAGMSTNDVKVELYPMRDAMVELVSSETNTLPTQDAAELTMYFRLFLPDMFPQYDRGIYLDADTIVNTDIAQFYELDLEGNMLGAIHDGFIEADPILTRYAEKGHGFPAARYFNSGVLLMDFALFRELDFTNNFSRLLNTYHVKLIASDQDYLNVMCGQRTKLLPEKWNVMSGGLLGRDWRKLNPLIIHYNLFGKPWHYEDAPMAELFWKYAPHSAFYQQLRDTVENFNGDMVADDERKKQKLIAGAQNFPDNDVTFAKLVEQGVKVAL
ncbi:glycosyltransferase family 8 protein [Alloscardovia venturai]|uniref:Glycosyltransferase family 8 protein n=1 Tax=Alloscardovia venturai TaxID=1769421 RepID=A0ABW2Y4S9_9BIFI